MIHTYGAEEVRTWDKTSPWMCHTCHSARKCCTAKVDLGDIGELTMHTIERRYKWKLEKWFINMLWWSLSLCCTTAGPEESHWTWPLQSLKTTDECNILAMIFILSQIAKFNWSYIISIQPMLYPALYYLIMGIVMMFFFSMNCKQWILHRSFIQQRLCGELKLKSVSSVIPLVNTLYVYKHTHTHIMHKYWEDWQ